MLIGIVILFLIFFKKIIHFYKIKLVVFGMFAIYIWYYRRQNDLKAGGK